MNDHKPPKIISQGSIKMKIPQKINILGRIYTVILCDPADQGNDNLGTHWLRYTKIYINDQQDEQARESCLIHEIIHAINGILDIGLKEAQTRRLEAGLYQVLKENKLF